MSTVTPQQRGAAEKRPFDIDLAMVRIREAIRPFPPAALFASGRTGLASWLCIRPAGAPEQTYRDRQTGDFSKQTG